MSDFRILEGDALETLRTLPSESVQCCVTSPPYWGLRNYGVAGQVGLEATPDAYVATMVAIFREVRRVLRSDGTLWLNIGDCFATGAGAVGDCPGGGAQGERFKNQWEAGRKGKDANLGHVPICGGEPRLPGREHVEPLETAALNGYRGTHADSPKHSRKQVPDTKNPNANIPTFQPNRMPIAGLKPKDLVGIPWMLAFALRADGWWLRMDNVWNKDNPMPESVRDRPTKAHEYVFLLVKSERYYYDHEAVTEDSVSGHGSGNGFKRDARLSYADKNGARGNDKPWIPRTNSFKREGSKRGIPQGNANNGSHRPDREDVAYDGPTRNRRSVWTIPTRPFSGAHFAVMPEALVEPCVLAGCPEGGTVLDPFTGSGTVAVVALRHGRSFQGIELNPKYVRLAYRRILRSAPLLHAAPDGFDVDEPTTDLPLFAEVSHVE